MARAQTYHRGEAHHHWKGGRSITRAGVRIRLGEGHPQAKKGGYALEHRLVAEQALGRRLTANERVWHKDGDKTNNAWENLDVRKHRSRDTSELILCACGCGRLRARWTNGGKGTEARFLRGHGPRPGGRGWCKSKNAPAVTPQILTALEEGPATVYDISERIGQAPEVLRTMLSRLRKRGAITYQRVRHPVTGCSVKRWCLAPIPPAEAEATPDNFETFTAKHLGGAQTSPGPQVTTQKRGELHLNRQAMEALGRPEAVHLLFDHRRRVMGIRAAPLSDPHSFKVRPQAGHPTGGKASLRGFASRYGLDISATRRFPATMEGVTLVVDLTQPSQPISRPHRLTEVAC